MSEQFTEWDPVQELKSEEDIANYLEACLKYDSGDGSLSRAALSDIARAAALGVRSDLS